MSEAIDEIRQRCVAAGLEFEERNPRNPQREGLWWVVKIPKGREVYELVLEDETVAELTAGDPFEEYVRLSGYEASWSREHQVIECTLSTRGRPLAPRNLEQISRRLGQRLDVDQASVNPEQRLDFPSALPDISIGPSSNVHAVLTNRVRRPFRLDLEVEEENSEVNDSEACFRRLPTLQIKDVTVETHDAVKLLERIGNALFFQIDLSLEITRERERFRRRFGHQRL